MNKALLEVLNLIQDPSLRALVGKVVDKPAVKVDGKVYKGLPLDKSPAAMVHHHSYEGGLVDHVVASARVGLALCEAVERVYDASIDRDVVLAALVLHDVFKTVSYSKRSDGGYDMTELAQRLDHHTLITADLIRRGFPLRVIHAVLSAHGRQGPMSPRTLEALVTHLADVSDSSLVEEVQKAAQFAVRECLGLGPVALSAKEAFRIVRGLQDKGCKGVSEAFSGAQPAK